jgi:hypothetical protein
VIVTNNCGASTLTATNFTGTLLWSTGATTASITVTAAGSYSVTQTINGFTSPAGAGTASPAIVPVATALTNSPVIIGSTLSLTGGPAGMNGYVWSGPNSFASTAQNPSISGANAVNAGIYTVTVTNANSCSASASSNVILSLSGGPYYTINGTLFYNNAESTPLSQVTLGVPETGATATTNTNGNYSFPYLSAGIYTLGLSAINKPVSDINSTDAAQANYWCANQVPIEHVKFMSGDVSDNNFINATDALKIQNHFVSGTPFDRTLISGSPWVYWKSGDIIQHNSDPNTSGEPLQVTCSGNMTVDLLAMIIGDFNGSYVPATAARSSISSVQMLNNEIITTGAGEVVQLQIKLIRPATVGAVSLILKFPSNLFDVTGVTMKDNVDGPAWSISDDELRIGWNSLQPREIGFKEELLTIHGNTSREFGYGDRITLELINDQLNELADANYQVMPDVTLSTEVVEFSSNGINVSPSSGTLTMTCYPNPFSESATIACYVPEDGQVVVQISELTGHLVTELANEPRRKGNFSVPLDMKNLVPGIYMASILLKSNKVRLTRTIKVVLNRF